MVDTIVAERAGVLAYVRVKCGHVDGLLQAGRLGAADAAAIKQVLRATGDEIATGLHRDGQDPDGVRAAMREVIRG